MRSKNQKRRQKKKEAKSASVEVAPEATPAGATPVGVTQTTAAASGTAVPETSSVRPSPEGSRDDSPKPDPVFVLSRKYDWLSEDDPLYGMYKSVSSRLKRKRDPPQEPLAANLEPEAEHQPVSKKQQRLAAKPSLAKLKAMTPYPELIEWYDADARYPEFLVHMKSVPRAVQVPSNWRLRQEIPQFAAKDGYSPPEPLRATQGDQADVDYEHLHSLFFGPNAHYENSLLPFGEVVDLNLRRRAFKPGAPISPPTQLSTRLRSALGLKPGEALPWAKYVAEHGLAPGFAQATSPPKLWGELS